MSSKTNVYHLCREHSYIPPVENTWFLGAVIIQPGEMISVIHCAASLYWTIIQDIYLVFHQLKSGLPNQQWQEVAENHMLRAIGRET